MSDKEPSGGNNDDAQDNAREDEFFLVHIAIIPCLFKGQMEGGERVPSPGIEPGSGA